MKILYAANNQRSSYLQLSRFISNTQHRKWQIKIAAYQISSPKNVNIDWNLNALLDMHNPQFMKLNNDNLEIYYQQVKSYRPDLIITDLEYFSSQVANSLNIPIWQVSSSMLYDALIKNPRGNDRQHKLGVFFGWTLDQALLYDPATKNTIDHADRKLVYSHFGDISQPPKLNPGYEWVRPYHQLGKDHITCRHNFTAAMFDRDLKTIEQLKRYQDGAVFMRQGVEKYPGLLMKDLSDENEFYCNLKNSPFFVCRGEGSLMADSYYNGRYCLIYPNYQDVDCVVNAQLSKKRKLGNIVSYRDDLFNMPIPTIMPHYKTNIKYLDELINVS